MLSESSERDWAGWQKTFRSVLSPNSIRMSQSRTARVVYRFAHFLLNLKAEYVRQYAKRRRSSQRWGRNETTAMRERPVSQQFARSRLEEARPWASGGRGGCGARNKRWVSYPCEVAFVGMGSRS